MSSASNDDPNCAIVFEGAYYSDVNGYQVPQNIHHRFRSNITAHLLTDREKVERDKNEQHYANIKQQRQQPIYHRPQAAAPSADPDYAKLSNDLRSTVCRGIPVQRRSHTKTVHNADIFQDQFREDQPNPYRRRKDWLGRWMEADVIRDRLYKSILDAKKNSTA